MKLKTAFLVAIIIGFYSYKKYEKIKPELNGVWNSIGYGQQIVITDTIASIYDVYKGGCALKMQLPRTYVKNYLNITRLTNDSLTIKLGFTKYHFSRSTHKVCKESRERKNALVNFDALWHTFNENYASFKLREIDWKKSKEKYRSQLNDESTELELFSVLNKMISELNDNHVSIDIPESLEKKIEENEDDNDEVRELVISKINSRYIKKLKTYNRGTINWGIINENIGYIQINDFEDLANYSISQKLSNEDFWNEYWEKAERSKNYQKDVLKGFKKQISKVFKDIKQTKSCIIDVRFNGGGFDQLGLELLGYFTDKKTIAFTKKARLNNGFTKKQAVYIEPNKKQYTGSLYILTSSQTASASETFVLASQNLPKVKRIGSNTEGVLSDILSKKLPNGWEYELSNEIYENDKGINYEKIGIPADYTINYKKNEKEFYSNLLEELNRGDKGIEKVIELSEK